MNLANKITLTRIFLIPIFMVVLLSNIPNAKIIAAFIFIIASATDGLDGYIARSRNMVTSFGKFIDPLADKLLVTAALLVFLEMNTIPSWAVMVILSREFIVTGLRIVAVSEGIVIAASVWGKIKTISQMVASISILFDNIPFKYYNIPFDTISFYIAVVLTVYSGVDYMVKNWNLIKLK